MDGLCKEDRIDDAVALLDEMQIEGCDPTPPTFNVLINGLCKKGDLARAAKLIDNMFLKGCVPNEVTYNTLIHGLCLRGKLDKAVNLLSRMLSNKLKPNDITYGTIVNGLVKKGPVTCMLSEGCDPDSVTCKFFLIAFREKLDPPLDGGDFLDELVLRLQKCDRIIGASNIIQVMLRNFLQPKASTWDKVIRGICKPKRTEAAINKCWGDLFF